MVISEESGINTIAATATGQLIANIEIATPTMVIPSTISLGASSIKRFVTCSASSSTLVIRLPVSRRWKKLSESLLMAAKILDLISLTT